MKYNSITSVAGYKKATNILEEASKKSTSKKPARSNSSIYQNKLRILENVMKKSDVPEMFYSVGSYTEEAICIDRNDSSWIVYAGERGNQHNLKKYSKFEMACTDFLSRVAESDEQEEALKDAYKTLCKKARPRRIPLAKASYGIKVSKHSDAIGKKL